MRIRLGTKYQLKLTNSDYLDHVYPKKVLPSKTEEVNTTIDFCIVELVSIPNFSLKWQFWFFESNFLKKGIFG